MADQASPTSPTALAPPAPSRKSLEDPGAHELESSDNDDHFSSASEGEDFTRASGSDQGSPIPTTRVEKIDDAPSHGEVPGTDAYKLRTQDAVPDEVEVVEESRSSSTSRAARSPSTSGPESVPTTMVDKVDPTSPSHGDVPGTAAHEKRKLDAVPDVVRRMSVSSEDDKAGMSRARSGSTPGDLPIPVTKISKVDTAPSHGEVPGTEAYNMRTQDAAPDEVEDQESSQHAMNVQRTQADGLGAADDEEGRSDGGSGNGSEEDEGGFGDDFDEFEEGGGDDDFGDFDDGFQQGEEAPDRGDTSTVKDEGLSSLPDYSFLPMLDFAELKSVEDIVAATKPYMDHLFPLDDESTSAPLEPLPEQESIFLSDRSLSLWSQLVATPPLQPPNWVRSRIRRLFLVSLGVPVDLDEILPASKQKKLVLPSIHLSGDTDHSPLPPSDSRSEALKKAPANTSSTSVNSQTPASSSSAAARKRRGPPPAPALDLSRAAMLCATTDAALTNLPEDELRAHLQTLEEMARRAGELLEYWLKRKDGAIGDKEAFEGVIENLVKHARKVRK